MDNPFSYGKIVDGLEFVGREDEQAELLQDMRNSQNVILMSPRRYGKTSLIKKVLKQLPATSYYGVFLDLFRVSSHRRFIEAYSKAIGESCNNKLEDMIQMIKTAIPIITPKIVLTAEGIPEFGVELNRHNEKIDEVIEQLFELPEKIALKKKKRIVIVMDEFQDIVNLKDDGILKLLRSCLQNQKHVSYCFMGSRKHMLNEIFYNKNQPLYNCGKTMCLRRMSRETIDKFIIGKFKLRKVTISKDALEQIFEITRGHIYYVQMLGYYLWNQIDTKSTVLDTMDIKRSINGILASQGIYHEMIWNTLTNSQKNLLMAIHHEGFAKFQSAAQIQKYDLGTSALVIKNYTALVKKEVLEYEKNTYSFADVFLPHWLSQSII